VGCDLYPCLHDGNTEDLVMIATPVSVDWEEVFVYEGFSFLLNTENGQQEKALYVKFPRADGWLNEDFTQAVVALIDLAEIILECDRLFVCVDREAKEMNSLVHSLMYVGFTIAESSLCGANNRYLMLEYETE